MKLWNMIRGEIEMTRRDFGKLFVGAMVGLGLKSAPILTTFPDGIPWPITPEEEAWLFVNVAANRFIWPVYQSTMIGGGPFLGHTTPRKDVINNKMWQAESWLKEQDYKFSNKELA